MPNNYDKATKKINTLLNKQQEIDNTLSIKDYDLQKLHESSNSKKITYLESAWVLCTKTTIYTEDDCFEFLFAFSSNLQITEKQLINVDHVVLFKGNVISHKASEEEVVVYGNYNPNLNFVKLADNKYKVTISGTGIGDGSEDIYAKLLIAIKNYRQHNTINKYEQS
jgi:hypothetical protein